MKKQVKVVLYLITLISLIACSVVGVNRIKVENNSTNAEIVIRYSDVLSIARHKGTTIEEVLEAFKKLGATTLLVRENTVLTVATGDFYNYKEQGKANVIEGYILKYYYPDVKNIDLESTYIVTQQGHVAADIYNNYFVKDINCSMFSADGEFYFKDELAPDDLEENNTYFVQMNEQSSALYTVGVGFDKEDLNKAASLGYSIAPQIKTWAEPSVESIAYVMDQINELNNVQTIYFADQEVPGADKDEMYNELKDKQLGFIEFTSNKQKGFGLLAKKLSDSGKSFHVVRLHTLTDMQAKTFSPQEILDRYELALRERNLRAFLFKMPNTSDADQDIEVLQNNITAFSNMAVKEGYTITAEPNEYNLPLYPAYLSLICGLAAIVVFIFFMAELKFIKLGYVLAALGLIGYTGLLKVNPNFACKAMALFGAIIFPTYALIKGLNENPRNMKETIMAFVKICFISFGGVLTIIGTLSRTSFGLGIDVFMGVKFSYVAPVGLVLAILFLKANHITYKYVRELFEKKISYGAAFVIGLVAVVLFIYTTRTGNTGTASQLERNFRQLLDSTLGVRPRTKEFLIGYPILMCLLYFGCKQKYLILAAFAAIGPVSFVNTYGHIHTPILISLTRSVYGMLIGIIIGEIAIIIIKKLIKVVKKWQQQEG